MSDISRKEDMSSKGELQIHRQPDGDIVIRCVEYENDRFSFASVEFCSIGMGGGRSPNTLEALRNLMKAMEEDNRKYPIE